MDEYVVLDSVVERDDDDEEYNWVDVPFGARADMLLTPETKDSFKIRGRHFTITWG